MVPLTELFDKLTSRRCSIKPKLAGREAVSPELGSDIPVTRVSVRKVWHKTPFHEHGDSSE
ncbi:hypothetical protein HanIR_Chr12g0596461 [Helianthus annuus]|nr:hypothetical protein HanIR_Chr12g0596461 [Helianthus annuus]